METQVSTLEDRFRRKLDRQGLKLLKGRTPYRTEGVGYMVVSNTHGGAVAGSESGMEYLFDLQDVKDWINN
jgi:hypothetical protein